MRTDCTKSSMCVSPVAKCPPARGQSSHPATNTRSFGENGAGESVRPQAVLERGPENPRLHARTPGLFVHLQNLVQVFEIDRDHPVVAARPRGLHASHHARATSVLGPARGRQFRRTRSIPGCRARAADTRRRQAGCRIDRGWPARCRDTTCRRSARHGRRSRACRISRDERGVARRRSQSKVVQIRRPHDLEGLYLETGLVEAPSTGAHGRRPDARLRSPIPTSFGGVSSLAPMRVQKRLERITDGLRVLDRRCVPGTRNDDEVFEPVIPRCRRWTSANEPLIDLAGSDERRRGDAMKLVVEAAARHHTSQRPADPDAVVRNQALPPRVARRSPRGVFEERLPEDASHRLIGTSSMPFHRATRPTPDSACSLRTVAGLRTS